MIECRSGGGVSLVSVRTVRIVQDTRNGVIARVYGGEAVMPWECVRTCSVGEVVEAPHLISGMPVTETEMRR